MAYQSGGCQFEEQTMSRTDDDQLMEGVVVGVDNNNEVLLHGGSLDCSLDELKELITNIYSNDWAKAINHTY
jgi:hypothetical protein